MFVRYETYSGRMHKLTPLAALAIFWFIGIVFGKPGIWFPLGVLAMIAMVFVQKRLDRSGHP